MHRASCEQHEGNTSLRQIGSLRSAFHRRIGGSPMMTVMDLARIDTRLSRVCSNEYAGPCPGCSGTDRFHVKLTKRDGQGGFMCRYCWPAEEKGWGDNIDYLRHFKHMTYGQAVENLGLQEKTYSLPSTHMT